ncbi:hypothetical protein BT93_F3323 [Corymbia citriodora subsp. variegata]|nr:hypothetical protein BT93_F3323 [Corymbia citriodora subsp. variegata]
MVSFKLGRGNRLCRVSGRSRSMGLQDGNSLLLIFILFLTCICTPASSRLESSRHDEANACETVNCVMGTCRETDVWPGSVCDCFSGWTKLGILPPCIIPNCSFTNQCGGEPPLPLPPIPSLLPPIPSFLPPINFSLSMAPCLLMFCGDGDCVPSGSSHQCQCHQGSANLLARPDLPCLRQYAPNCSRSYRALSWMLLAVIIVSLI